MLRGNNGKTRLKLKGKQLREMQDKAAIVGYAIEKALTDCFLREEIFELLDAARDSIQDIERVLHI